MGSNTYKNTAPVQFEGLEPNATGELELTAEQEADALAAGWLEIQPREYRVIGTREVHGTEPGKTFKAAFTVAEEAALTAAGHIERITPKPAAARNDKAKENK